MALLFRNARRLTTTAFKKIKTDDLIKCAQTNRLYCRPVSSCFLKHDVFRVSAFTCRNYAIKTNEENAKPPEPVEKPGLVARFKQMYRDYWYVLVPVHVVTSIGWLGAFYYMAKSGVDVIAILKSLGVSDKFTDPLKDSSMGYVALAYALYKIATPIRYTVTLGGTTISIKYLQAWGYIKPIPSKEKLKEMYQTKKEGLQEIYAEKKLEMKHRKQQITDRKDHVMSDIAKYKQEMAKVKEDELKNK